ncbi:MAG: LysM peptidoglycan-binding domain-containing protein [Pseudohongiellaceae bacterium]
MEALSKLSVTAFLLLCLTVPSISQAQSAADFPRPPELEPAINFWVKVYTEADTRSGFLHDSEHLSVIYEKLPRTRSEIESRRKQIQSDLRILATGKRDSLTSSQREILALWPEGVSDQTLLRASSHVRWQLGQSDRFLGGLKRSGAYRSHINQVIREKQLPIELAVLPHVESSFNPGAYSSASAAGMWQFGRATGQRFMRIDHIVDERMDPYIATNAAMSLLQYNYSVLGTWPLALTAYNHGAGGIARAVRETGTQAIETIVANYKGRAFGFASRNFYAQFLAVLQVENNAREHFGDIRLDPAPNFRIVEMDSFIDAEVFASSLGISLEQLKADNPALRPVVWEGNKRIPRGFPVKLRAAAVAERGLLAMVDNDYKFAVQTPDVAYVIEKGDSLSVIARRFDTTVARLVSLNQLASRNRIRIGQRLLLPQSGSNGQQLAFGSSSNTSAPSNGMYSVRRGDTVSVIAARFRTTEQELLNLNGIADKNRIYPGQQLRLPGFDAGAVQVAAIDTTLAPTPPTEISFADENKPANDAAPAQIDLASNDEAPVVDVSVEIEESIDALVEEPTTVASRDDEALPPAAVLPDDQSLDTTIAASDETAVAVEPNVGIQSTNEQLTQDLAADPSDYTVASNNTIEIQASETLGHYADWLEIRAWDVRRLNNMQYRDPVIIGDRLRLDFETVSVDEFVRKRRDFHSSLQREFFSNYRIRNVETYRVKRNDNISRIARSRYSAPIWLVRQYNPGLDFGRIQIGQEIIFPLLEPTT